jgi:tripartite-type tricarboxylate transporter receptor subunit TctC
MAPSGTSPELTARLNREIGQYLKGSEIGPRLLSLWVASDDAGTPESTAQIIRQEQEQWLALGKELNIEPR